jgi:hypothetical protein
MAGWSRDISLALWWEGATLTTRWRCGGVLMGVVVAVVVTGAVIGVVVWQVTTRRRRAGLLPEERDGIAVADIAEFLDEIRVVRRKLTRPDIPAESPAAHYAALTEEERGTAALTDRVVILADLWTLIAGEQLSSIAALLRAGEFVFGIFPLARSVIEHSTAVVWVLDPTCTVEERCARAALAMDRSNEELVTASAHLSSKQNETYKARRGVMRQHRADVVAQFPDGTDLDAHPRSVAGQALMSPTDLVKHFAESAGYDAREWEGIYDYLCAAANHPTLAAFEFFAETSDRGHLPIMSQDFLERLVRAVLAAYLMALQRYAAYCDWDEAAVQELRGRSEELFPDRPRR